MKNLLHLTFILSIVIVFGLNTFGQQQFGIKVSGGLSQITNSMKSSNYNITPSFVPSGLGGLYCNLSLGKNISFGTELIFSQIEGKEELVVERIMMEGNNLGHFTGITYRHISYLSLPVYFGYTIKRLTINGGFQISYALASSGRKKENLTFYGFPRDETNSSNVKIDDIYIKKFDFGPRAGIVYHLTDRLAVEGTYYYGIHNIQNEDPEYGEWKVQQMTLGIRYSLWSKEAAQ
ncbi:MAG TPA: porin family protein [Prolixibacteraceae bacterium]|jgi:opacity protein-like surface antigen